MPFRIPWDRYEAALLLAYCVDVEEGNIPHKEAVSVVSQKLRSRAIAGGYEIDEIFRNENEISMQMASIRSCYLGKEDGLTGSKLFRDVVALYKEDYAGFQRLLREGTAASNWQEFRFWLRENLPDKEKTIISILSIVSVLARKNKLIERPIGETDDPEAIKALRDAVKDSGRVNLHSKKSARAAYQALETYREYLISKSAEGSRVDGFSKPSYTAQIEELISTRYKYGFRLGSPIERMRLRNYANAANVSLPESDEELEKEICAASTVIDGKAFVLASDTLDFLRARMAGIFRSGCGVIFLEAFYDKNMDFMEKNHIASRDMLKEILKRSCPEYYYGQNIVTPGKKKTETAAIMDEIYRLCGEDGYISCAQISEQLEYIPPGKILGAVSRCDDMVRIGDGNYFSLKNFVVNEGDAAAIRDYVEKECDRTGYASLFDIPMGGIPEENYELTDSALYTAIYRALLKGEYVLNGKILTGENAQVDIHFLLNSFCKNMPECTVTKMTEKTKELTGTANKQYAMVALLDTMVRVDEERFIAEDQIAFDAEAIDALLAQYIGEKFAPVKSIPTFALFPLCGTNWNYYVLESYCYRFSKRYRLSVINYNDKNAGLIVARNVSLTYSDMLSEAAAEADIDLTQDAVGRFFFDNGYTARRKYANLPDIVAKANRIREERQSPCIPTDMIRFQEELY